MATLKRWDASAFTDLTTRKRWDGSAFANLTLAKRWDGTAFVDIPLGGGGGSLSATVSPSHAFGSVTNSSLFVVVTSNSVTVTPVNGTGPYTHSWVRISGDSAPTPSSTTGATVSWSATVARDQEYTAVWQDTITDSLSATTTVIVTVTLMHNSTL